MSDSYEENTNFHGAADPSSNLCSGALGPPFCAQCRLLTCQHILNAVIMHEVVRSAGGGSLVFGQRLLQVDLQPVQGCQATVVLQKGPREGHSCKLNSVGHRLSK